MDRSTKFDFSLGFHALPIAEFYIQIVFMRKNNKKFSLMSKLVYLINTVVLDYFFL